MRNIDWLYQTNGMFRETVNQAAAQWMGSDSPAFAGAWLMEQHREERDELVGRHDDPSTYLSDAGVAAVKAFVAEHHGGGEKSDYEDLIGQHLDDGPCVVPNRDEQVDMVTDLVVAKIEERKLEMLREHCADQAEQLRRLTDENAELRKLAEKYRAGSVAAQEEAEAWRAKCGELLDAAHEMVRIGGDVA